MSGTAERPTARQLLDRMFEVEMRFLQAEDADPGPLATVFHPDVTIHEPASLPYAGDWTGPTGVGALFHRMRQAWSEVAVRDLTAARAGDTVYMSCTLSLTARATGVTVTQPFAEVLRFAADDRLVDGTPFYFDTGALAAALAAPAVSRGSARRRR